MQAIKKDLKLKIIIDKKRKSYNTDNYVAIKKLFK